MAMLSTYTEYHKQLFLLTDTVKTTMADLKDVTATYKNHPNEHTRSLVDYFTERLEHRRADLQYLMQNSTIIDEHTIPTIQFNF